MATKVYLLFILLFVVLVGGCSLLGGGTPRRPTTEESRELVENGEAARFVDNLFWPVKSKKITSRYGSRGSGFHDGLDIGAPYVERVYAAHGGFVIRQDQKFRGYGKLLVLQGEGIVTFYGHLDDYTVLIGDRVEKGAVIGFVGSTGRASGPHLHFETRIKNDRQKWIPVDPSVFFSKTTFFS